MKVLAIIDMQKDFIDGALGTKEAVAIVPKVAARLAQARADGETVVFTRDTHHADYLSTQEGQKLPVPHCLEGTDGWQIDAALPVLDAPVFDKVPLSVRADCCAGVTAQSHETALQAMRMCQISIV